MDLNSESWRPVVGWEGQYEVSDLGRIRSLARLVERPGSPCGDMRIRSRIRKQQVNPSTGHQQITFGSGRRQDGRKVTLKVHQVVLNAFVGPCPPGMEVLHYNDTPSDNRLSNLRYGTRTENLDDRVRNGKHHHANRTECVNGHRFTPENTVYVRRQNGRLKRCCKECRRAQSLAGYHKRKRQ